VTKKFLVCLILLALLASVPVTDAARSQAPFITIDPIGTYTVDDVFFITGTTNLPASGTPLSIQISSGWFTPAGGGCGYLSNATIEPGEYGINTWSCNTTPGLWQTYGIGPRSLVTPGAVPGEYLVTVVSPDPGTSANATRLFTLLSSNDTVDRDRSGDNTRFNVTLDPESDHFIGDSFVVKGTAQMPPGEKILVEIQPAHSHPGVMMEGNMTTGMSATVLVRAGRGTQGEWTCPVTLNNWMPGTYIVSVTPVNPKYGLSLTTQFTLSERRNITPGILSIPP
jgi:hypothetical protein